VTLRALILVLLAVVFVAGILSFVLYSSGHSAHSGPTLTIHTQTR
jgi:hypothetical protein